MVSVITFGEEFLFQLVLLLSATLLGALFLLAARSREVELSWLPVLTIFGICIESLVSVISFILKIGTAEYVLILFLLTGCLLAIFGVRKTAALMTVRKIVIILVFTLPLVVASSIVGFFLEFPPPGDVTGVHGPFTAQLFLSNFLPLSQSTLQNAILYPPGFSSLVAAFTKILGVDPPMALVSVATSVSILTPLLVGTIVWQYRRSYADAILASAIACAYNAVNLVGWVFGNLFNGTYPYLVGIAIVLSFIWLLQRPQSKWSIFQITIIILACLFIYPPFGILLLSLLSISVFLFLKRSSQLMVAARNEKVPLLALITSFILLSAIAYVQKSDLGLLIPYLEGVFFPNGKGFGGPLVFYSYQLQLSYFNSPVGVIDVAAMIILAITTIFFSWRVLRRIPVPFYVFILIVMFLSLSKNSFQLVSYLEPSRLFLISFLISVPVMLISFSEITLPNAFVKFFSNRRRILLRILVLLLVTTVALSPYLNSSALSGPNWFVEQPYFSQNYSSLEWMYHNIGSGERIMNDGSYSSMFLQSFNDANLTLDEYSELTQPTIMNTTLNFWKNPYDYSQFREIAQEFNISFVYSSDEWGYHLYGQFNGYYPRPFSPAQYLSILDGSPYLLPEFVDGNSAVYKVTNLNQTFHPDSTLVLDNASKFFTYLTSWGADGQVGTPTFVNSTEVLTPSGNNTSWGLYHYNNLTLSTQNHSMYAKIVASSNRLLGLSLVIVINSSIIHVDFLVGPDSNVIYLHLPFTSATITQLALATGFIPPYSVDGDQVNICSIGFGSFY